ncbi:MAG: phytanoyl-CoA dioxygenase family protein [Planctomycetota bacterium]
MVTPENLRQYREEGYTICRQVLEPAALRDMTAYIDRFIAEMSTFMRPEHLDKPHVWDRRFLDFCATPALLDHVGQFVGPDIVLFSSHIISKAKGDGLLVPWHQDAIYWELEPMDVITLWLAIDESTVGNGCMRVIPGTHTRGALEHVRDADPSGKVLDRGLKPEFVDESRAVDIELQPGDCSFHAPYLIHGSRRNTSPTRRCGYTMRFMPARTKLLRNGKLSQWFAGHPLFLLRGRDRAAVNVYANA